MREPKPPSDPAERDAEALTRLLLESLDPIEPPREVRDRMLRRILDRTASMLRSLWSPRGGHD